MATWGTRGLRGSTLEEMINVTNELYKEHKLALIQKVPTPIKPISIDKSSGKITSAYFDMKSTVDYIGVVQGIPICFDAKEISSKTFALQNIHRHQFEFMEEFEMQGGVSFLLVYFHIYGEIIYVPFVDIKKFVNRADNGGRKSFRYEELNHNYTLKDRSKYMVHYLEMIDKDLRGRDE